MEAMLAVAITAILAAMGGRLLIQINRFFVLSTTRSSLQKEARSAMYVMNRELRQAQNASIVIDRLSSSQPFYSRVTFTKSTSSSTTTGTTMTFEQSGSKLIQIVGTSSMTLTNNLYYLAFTFPRTDDMTIISVAMTLQKNIYEGRTKALHMASQKVQIMN